MRRAIKDSLTIIAGLLSCTVLSAQDQTVEQLNEYGTLDRWSVRKVKESGIIGGKTKYLYEFFGAQDTTETREPFTAPDGYLWRTNNVLAVVSGVTKTSNTVFPEKRGNGYCARIETHIETVKAMGIINMDVVCQGAFLLGSLPEPIKDTKNPMSKVLYGIPFTGRPAALVLDYKADVGHEAVRGTGFSKLKSLGYPDYPEIAVILQKRWEDKDGNIFSKRVGTMVHRYAKSSNGWVNEATYPILYPINQTFLESKGCPVGEAKSDTCEFGTTSPDSILYSGPFILTANDSKSKIAYAKNESYWDKDNVFLNTITYIYDDGSDKYSGINGFKNGQYSAAGLDASWADYANYVEEYADYITMTESNAYSFGIQWNFNRVNYNLTAKTTQAEKDVAQDAIHNTNVRLAVQAAFDTKSYMAVNMEEETALANLRNLNGVPNLVSTSDGTPYVTLVEEAYKELTGLDVDLGDGHAAFYNPDKAMDYINAAKEDGIEFPVRFDLLCISDGGQGYIDRANSLKASVEEATEGNIIIDIVLEPGDVVTDVAFNMTDPATQADYDFNTQAGWGPDYLDPSTFTDVFSVSRNGAFMPNIGMLTEGKTSAEVAKINEIAEQIGLTEYDRLNDEARAIVDDLDARYEAFAKVDAYLLANGLYLPVSMQTRGLKVTKVVPFTKPYALGGTGQYKLKFMKVQNDMVTKAQWEEAQAAWIEKVG